MIEGSLTFISGSFLLYVHHPAKFVDDKYQGNRDIAFLVFHVRPCDQSAMGLYELELGDAMVFVFHVTVRDHVNKVLYDFMVKRSHWRQVVTKFGFHTHCGIGDIMVSVCHVISQDQVMKALCDFNSRSPLR